MHFEDYFFSAEDMFFRTRLGRELARWVLASNHLKRVLASLGSISWLDWDDEGSEEIWQKHDWWAYAPRKRADEINREVLQWIGAGAETHPFFVVLNYFDVHAEYGGPPSYHRSSWAKRRGEGNEADQTIDQYDDGVNYVDSCIGRLINELARRGLTENTLIVITSDHGELLGEHGLPFHGRSLYTSLIRVPLIFWFPGRLPANLRVPGVVSTSLLPVTLSSWLPGNSRESFAGDSLARLWQPFAPAVDGYALSEISFNAYDEDLKRRGIDPVPTDRSGAMKSIMTTRWHLMTHHKLGDQLYEWKKDPQETHNLINTPDGRDAAALLRVKLLNLLAGHQPDEPGSEAMALNGR